MSNPSPFNRILLAILSIIFLFLIHIFIPNIGGAIAHQTEYLVWIGMGAIVLSGVLSAFTKGRLIESPFQTFLPLFAGLLLLSSLFNPIKNMDMFVINSMRLTFGILFWFALLQFDLTGRERLFILVLIFLSAGIESIIGVMQFFGFHRYIPVTPSPDGTIGGTFQQRNLFASWLATGLVASLYLITTNRFKNYRKWKGILFYLFVALLSLNLIIANSRTGLICTALAMVIILYSRQRHYLVARGYLMVWFMVFLIGIGGGLYLMSIKGRVGIAVEFPLYLSTAHYLLFLILLFLATSHLTKQVNLKLSHFIKKVVIVFSLILYIAFTGWTISTINSYSKLVRWYRDYTETEWVRWNEEDILPSTRNLYLRNWAVPLYMSARAVDSVKDVRHNEVFLKGFLEWSRLEKQRLPVWNVFYNEANILLAMSTYSKGYAYFDEAMRTAEEGLFLYPNHEGLKALRARIVSEAFKVIFKRYN